MARWLVASAAMVAYLGASPIVGDALIGPHERAYPALRRGSLLPGVGYVVVLGGGYTPRDSVPVTAALSHAGLVRIVEAIRLMRGLGVGKRRERLCLRGVRVSTLLSPYRTGSRLLRAFESNSILMIS